MKTYAEWSRSRVDMDRYLRPGDVVDSEMLDYALNVLPPIQRPGGWLAMGEPHDSDERGRALYLAFEGDIYRGPTAIADMRATR